MTTSSLVPFRSNHAPWRELRHALSPVNDRVERLPQVKRLRKIRRYECVNPIVAGVQYDFSQVRYMRRKNAVEDILRVRRFKFRLLITIETFGRMMSNTIMVVQTVHCGLY